ncbi:MAG: cytochrome b [Paracoccaceae bacterium]
MTRYHPVLIALHWVVAVLILGALLVGGPMLEDTPNSSPDKVGALFGHMTVGLVILGLMGLRLIVKIATPAPAHADTGHGLLDRLGDVSHWGFYALVLGVVLSGVGIARGADLFAIVYGGSGAPLPDSFADLGARVGHGILTKVLLALVGLHVAGWAYHQFILKDGLIRRMWFGGRKG